MYLHGGPAEEEKLVALVVKKQTAKAGGSGSIPGLGRSPGEWRGNPLQYSSWKIHGQRSLMGYRGTWWATCPQGCKEMDMTEVTYHTWKVKRPRLPMQET